MEYTKQLWTLILIFVVGFMYDKYKLRYDNEETNHYNLVSQYFMNNDSSRLAVSKKPIIWVHSNYEINARNWSSFCSRNTTKLNQPYKYITTKTIIDKCGRDFNICVIDDNTFEKIIPGWDIDMNSLADPIKRNIRRLAIARLLNTYGGMLVPDSIICFNSLIDVYNKGTCGDCDMFVGELRHLDTNMMGCKKSSPVMQEYIKHLELLNSRDYTDESKFKGDDTIWCMDKISKKKLNFIPGKLLGTRDSYGTDITLERLLGNSYVDIDENAVCLYIPDKEILQRSKYQWFSRLSIGQALSSDTIIGKYLVLANSNPAIF